MRGAGSEVCRRLGCMALKRQNKNTSKGAACGTGLARVLYALRIWNCHLLGAVDEWCNEF